MTRVKMSGKLGVQETEGDSGDKQAQAPVVQLYPFASEDDMHGVIVKVQPPREPEDSRLDHVPCDLVLSIDISGSMGQDAPMPSKPGEEQEECHLSVLDLVKHAARTIIETLDENDRLGIVIFSSHAKVLQPLTPMTASSKAETLRMIEDMEPLSATNLWHGIRDGLSLFKGVKDGQPSSTGRVPALLVLTDGVPNHMCPIQGYVPKLQAMGPLPATIHTFGFGYDLRSGLLKSIAEAGRGNYSFIPDAGMIGTVFIHAVANLQSTFANNAKLRLTYPSYLRLEETTGVSINKQEPVELQGDVPESLSSLTIQLGNIQYGQSRDIYFTFGTPIKAIEAEVEASGEHASPLLITAGLKYQHFTPAVHQVTAHGSALPGPSSDQLDPGEIAFHVSRSRLVAFLSTFSPLDATLEHMTLTEPPPDTSYRLRNLLATLPAAHPPYIATHPGCRALLIDLCGADALPPLKTSSPSDPTPKTKTEPGKEEPQPHPTQALNLNLNFPLNDPISSWPTTGQIILALTNGSYFARWGAHYLPSLAGAHARQVCNSFKDAGPLCYGADSPLFQRCRARLDEVFDALPAPGASWVGTGAAVGGGGGGIVNGVVGGGVGVGSRTRRASGRRGRGIGFGGWGFGAGGGGGGAAVTPASFSMSRYNDASSGCFAGCMRVALAGARKGQTVRIGRLRRGMEVLTPRGARKVVAVLKMPVARAEMCLVASPSVDGSGGGLLVTPWHPIRMCQGGGWVFPKEVAAKRVRYTGSVYSVLLERDEDAEAHAILVAGVWGVAMGHGITERAKERDARAHQFYGSYNRVTSALDKLPRSIGGLVLGRGLTRDTGTGLVNGFKKGVVRCNKATYKRQGQIR